MAAFAADHELHGWRRGLRWVKLISIGLGLLVVAVVVIVLSVLHTDYGRDKIRDIANTQLAKLFVGGGSVGKVEGTPFGDLVLRDVVLNGPDKKPAITIKKLTATLGVFSLVNKDIQLKKVIAEDVDIAMKRSADGSFEFANLLIPRDPNLPQTKSTWDVDLDDVKVIRGHIMIDTGQADLGVVNLDGVMLDATGHIHAIGTRNAGLRSVATWRERNAPITILARVNDDAEQTRMSQLDIMVGGVSLAASDVVLVKSKLEGKLPHFSGKLVVAAPKAAVAHLVPRIVLPGDVNLALQVDPKTGSVMPVSLDARVGTAKLSAKLAADLDAKHVTGTLETNELDLALLTQNKIEAMGGLSASFDVTQGAPGAFPTATASIKGHGTYQQIPRAEFTVELLTEGQHVTSKVAVTGPLQANIDAALTRAGNAFHLDRSIVTAAIADPARASEGKVPLPGSLQLEAHASGALLPSPDLAIKGTVNGKQLRMQDLRIASLNVAIDASHVPNQPHGKATVRAVDIVRGTMALGKLDLTAADRSDGRIAVTLTSHPKQASWLIDLDALVTPPGSGGTVIVDLGHHRIRAGNGTDWTGDGGHFVMDPQHFAFTNFETRSQDGHLALAAKLDRAGRNTGDLAANVAIDRLALAALGPNYRGELTAHAAVTRKSGRFAGTLDLSGKGLAVDATKPAVDLETKIVAAPGKVTVEGSASSGTIGVATIAATLAAPQDLANAAAWKRAGRNAITTATVKVEGVDLGQIANLLAQPVYALAPYVDHLVVLGLLTALTEPALAKTITETKPQIAGRLDGELTITPTTAKGDFKLQQLRIPQVRGLGRVDAELAIDQPSLGKIVPTLTVKVDQVGSATARAELVLPSDLFDPAAWQRVGLGAIHTASLKTEAIAFDPAMLERFGIRSAMRGTARIALEIGEGAKTAALVLDITNLRGSPVAEPVDAHFGAKLDGRVATASLTLKTQQGAVSLLDFEGKLPMTIAQLRADPASLETAALDATLTLQQTSAPALLQVFGREDLIAGTLDGKVAITGTIVQPIVKAKFSAADLTSRPGPLGRPPLRVIKTITLDVNYDQSGAKVELHGTEDRGGKIDLTAKLDPKQLGSATAKLQATHFELTPLLVFAPEPASSARGTLDADVAITGFDPRTAEVIGELHLKRARIPLAPSVGTLRMGQIDVVLGKEQIKLALTGKLGQGDLKLDGTIALKGVSLDGGQAKLILHHVSPIGSVEPQIDSEITAKIGRQAQTWVADISVDKTFVKIPKTGGEALKPIGPPKDLHTGLTKIDVKQAVVSDGTPDAPPPPTQPIVIAHITINKTEVESEAFRTTIAGKLNVSLDADSMGVTGQIAANSGDLDLFGRRYRIERAAVYFDGTIDPQLDVRITHDFPDITTVTQVRGRLSQPKLVLSSDPGQYSQSELLGFLLGGEPNGNPNSGSARSQATAAGASFIANQIGGYVKKALPFALDVIRYESASATSSAAVTVGSWVTHTLFFSVTQHLAARPDENASEGTIEYWFTRQLELETTVGDRSYDGIDLLWRHRY
ncbi:hypothetical protein BH11MYX1_BH11MYX1_06460 [soil metagenome]